MLKDLGTMEIAIDSNQWANCLGLLGERGLRSMADSLGQCEKAFSGDWIERIGTRCTQTERIETWIDESNSNR
ncbi:hypothetical protein TorRG33x02_130170 [Trema orientale]|uniref:Uncharacterized protein n=1 Tax=Trema orientale TaxID=63057 RepID=A0A2P5F0A6_TREOI|nr:hypothetical protein TorRG33x02_130170 [Trema orientale]